MNCECAACTTVRVSLVTGEVASAIVVAESRYKEDRKSELGHRFGAPNSVVPDIVGALCEAAFAKHIGLAHRKGRLGDRDVGGYQVRGSEGSGRSLILHRSDDDEHVFVYVALTSSIVSAIENHQAKCTIVGWCRGVDGKSKQWWSPGVRQAYFVPQGALRSIRTLPRVGDGHV